MVQAARSPVYAGVGLAATSHPLATEAAAACLRAGGNAVDAAVCAAAMLCVVEPMSTGIGGDCFALVYDDGDVSGLNASGRAPAAADPAAFDEIPFSGPRACTVPGAVSGWAALLARHGSWGLDRCLAPAIDTAAGGFEVTPVVAALWQGSAERLADDPESARIYLPAPRAGERRRLPDLAATLRRIAQEGADALYRGPVASAIAAATWLTEEDLAAHEPEWVEPLRIAYRDAIVVELPPNGQGAAALQALGVSDGLDVAGLDEADRIHVLAEALKLAFADAYRYLADEPLPAGYLDPAYLAERRRLIDRGRAGTPSPGPLPRGDTVYLCVVDGERRACSLIQSLYYGFGSAVTAPGTGVVLQNRAAGFTLEAGHPNRLAPRRRPYHTIIPGLLLHPGGALLGPFGLMGGHMQPQGHLQLVSNLLDRHLDPQAALAAARFRLDGPTSDDRHRPWSLALERELWPLAGELRRRGHDVVEDGDPLGFGGGQVILVDGDRLVGGSEPRKDGHAAGL